MEDSTYNNDDQPILLHRDPDSMQVWTTWEDPFENTDCKWYYHIPILGNRLRKRAYKKNIESSKHLFIDPYLRVADPYVYEVDFIP